MSEKASQEILPTLPRAGGAACAVAVGERVQIEGRIVRQGIGFEVGPQVFDGIEFGSSGP